MDSFQLPNRHHAWLCVQLRYTRANFVLWKRREEGSFSQLPYHYRYRTHVVGDAENQVSKCVHRAADCGNFRIVSEKVSGPPGSVQLLKYSLVCLPFRDCRLQLVLEFVSPVFETLLV